MATAALPASLRSPAARRPATADYRADIDGLRAVAVLPVVLFHAGFDRLGGGYVGVDVFFVISGYLITCIIWREVREDRFSIVNFYERRIRRIFPALAALLAFVLIAAAALYLPRDFSRVPGAVAATLGFVSNILFYTQADYFHPAAELNPLLHTWSLAVEEQYYLFFPLFMAIMYRWARRLLVPTLVAIAILSFLVSAYGAFRAPTFTFYMAPTRVWELFAGSLLAIGLVPAVASRAAREGLAALGLALILIAVFLFTEHTLFPGLAALLPVVGSALVIHCARETLIGRLLSRGPIVFVGLISYSLYLWHWPAIVFAQYYLGRPLDGSDAAIVVAFSLLAATASWRFIEQPFRDKRRVRRRRIFAWAAAGAAMLSAAAASAALANGWPSRFSGEALRLADYEDDISPRREACHRGRFGSLPLDRSCVYGAETAPTLAIWGDSHVVELAEGLDEVAKRHGVSFRQFSYSACGPTLSVAPPEATGCLAFNHAVRDLLMSTPELNTIILVVFADNDQFRGDRRFAEDFVRTADMLVRAGRRVVIVHPIPSYQAPVPQRLALIAQAGRDPESLGVSARAYLDRNREFLRRLDELRSPLIAHVRPAEAICRGGYCRAYRGGHALYFDSHHLSVHGARFVASLFDSVFEAARPRQRSQPNPAEGG